MTSQTVKVSDDQTERKKYFTVHNRDLRIQPIAVLFGSLKLVRALFCDTLKQINRAMMTGQKLNETVTRHVLTTRRAPYYVSHKVKFHW